MKSITRKIVFIDIDGTLVNDDGSIPVSAQEACKQARKNGHLLYLCTGRSKAEIYDSIWEIGFDGLIGAGGGYVEYGNEVLYHKKVTDADVRHMVDFFNEHGIDFYLESNSALYASSNLQAHLERRIYGDVENDPAARAKKETKPHPFITGLTYGEADLYKNDVNKVCFLESPVVPFERIKQEFEGKFEVIQCTVPVFGEGSGELMIPGIHKAIAIADLLEHLGMSREDTLAIGDGMNDAEMLEFCAVGIAMGNAKPGLKEIADDITASVEEDGLYHSFVKYGLIRE
ncbi:Cof-type HAD-IIB family hydrolase [Paenibacillus barcinonensis]|uniref:Cof subfamily protein (Haloacid dehalogenase superfamily)/HAD superfamily hydrolase (TIGR01484 family) n=1 Tax=Paenibacillus barcinonensis TaxID=198119 RepID=A0A2V4VAQ9_PAEBA|nr:Cof-type HAD-IIB family hydrolase [Paenibacillus barcinonensis]PYE43252.1 Cof subfamily protein (haloacid dehalogenase superfamily)/HAD superfamily hydrolase (TIGR01484 family) [Paenibacillus barcinonensis]QKS55614.1 Cof-type HAD-IIB family hydrolase [Paenibacillus barcinonensis]